MDDLCRNLLHKAACGHLVQGLVHNMSGPLQILSMQIELMKTSFGRLLKEAGENCRPLLEQQQVKLDQIDEQIERLRSILNTINEVTEENATSMELNQLLQQALTFWEGDLRFKHQVKKELNLAQEPLFFFAPPGPVRQGLCALFWWLVPHLVETQGALSITTKKTEAGPMAFLEAQPALPPRPHPFLEVGQEILSPFVETQINGETLTLLFRRLSTPNG